MTPDLSPLDPSALAAGEPQSGHFTPRLADYCGYCGQYHIASACPRDYVIVVEPNTYYLDPEPLPAIPPKPPRPQTTVHRGCL